MIDQSEYVRLEGPEVDAFMAEVKTVTDALDGCHQDQLVTFGHGMVHQVAKRKGSLFAAAWLRRMADAVEAHAYLVQGTA